MIKLNRKGFTAVEALLIVIILAIIGGTGYYVYHSKQQSDKLLNTAQNETSAVKVSTVNTFADCQKAAGSITQQSFPEVCVTKSGQHFTQPNTQNPTEAQIQAAHTSMLAYCNKNKGDGDTCSVDSSSDKTAPGFVETNGGSSTSDGLADSAGTFLADDLNGSWKVIWFGQDCISTDLAAQYSIPSVFNICTH